MMTLKQSLQLPNLCALFHFSAVWVYTALCSNLWSLHFSHHLPLKASDSKGKHCIVMLNALTWGDKLLTPYVCSYNKGHKPFIKCFNTLIKTKLYLLYPVRLIFIISNILTPHIYMARSQRIADAKITKSFLCKGAQLL